MAVSTKIPAWYYQQFDADLSRDVPAEGYGGWKQAELDFDLSHTALAVMHAWDCGTPQQFPGWYRCVEYIPRANRIAQTVFPPLLQAVRAGALTLYHIVGAGDQHKAMPGYRRAVSLAKPVAIPRLSVEDPSMAELNRFKSDHVFVGAHNQEDVRRGFAATGFMREAMPRGEEGVAEDADQLFGLCQADGITHLVYVGFAINWCLLKSPGGMVDMSRRGLMCSTIRQAVTAVENRETARQELCKETALWRVALAFGFVFDLEPFVKAISGARLGA